MIRHRRIELLHKVRDIVGQATLGWIEHDASTRGAALAFYTLFSIAPILIIAIGLFGVLIGADRVRADLLPQMQNLFGAAGTSAVQALLSIANYVQKSRLATVVGVVTLLIGASTVFVELQHSLDLIWETPKRSKIRGIWRVIRARFLSLGLVFGVGFLLMVSLLVSTVLAAFAAWFASHLGAWQTLLLIIDVSMSVAVSTVLFALVYKYLPLERLAWRDVWVGSLVTAVLFNIGKFAIGYYLGKSAFASVYGAAGSLLVLLLWTYYSAQIFLFGAELTKSYSYILGSHVSSASSKSQSGI
jgi:membrane protein